MRRDLMWCSPAAYGSKSDQSQALKVRTLPSALMILEAWISDRHPGSISSSAYYFLVSLVGIGHNFIMKTYLSLFLLCMGSLLQAEMASPANADLLRQTLPAIKLERAPLTDAIKELRELSKLGEEQVNFFISPEAEEGERIVTLDLRGVTGMDALAMILRQTATRAELRRNILWILPNP